MKLLLTLFLFVSCSKPHQLTVITRNMEIWSQPATDSENLCKVIWVKDSIWIQTVNGPDPIDLGDTLSPQRLYIKGDSLYWGWPGKIISTRMENY